MKVHLSLRLRIAEGVDLLFCCCFLPNSPTMSIIIDVITLIGVIADFLSTIFLACLEGHCKSDCCGGKIISIEHDDATSVHHTKSDDEEAH